MRNRYLPVRLDERGERPDEQGGFHRRAVEWTNLCLLYLRAHESKLEQPVLGDWVAAKDIERIEYDFGRMHGVLHPDVNQFMVALRSAHSTP